MSLESRGTVRTRTGSGVITDVFRSDPVDRRQTRARRIVFWGGLLVAVALVLWCTLGA